jgi:hypothetical protein
MLFTLWILLLLGYLAILQGDAIFFLRYLGVLQEAFLYTVAVLVIQHGGHALQYCIATLLVYSTGRPALLFLKHTTH